jgi:hypothetical protein
MNAKLAKLEERRQQLVAQSAAQRDLIAQHTAPWRAPLALADRGLAVVHYVKQHPVLMVGTFGMLGLMRLTRAGKWLQSGWIIIQVARTWLTKS